MRLLLSILCLFLTFNSEGQPRSLEGIVIDGSDNSPIIGAIVYHSDTKTICSTDFNGKFSIPLTNSGKTDLYVYYTGYQCKIQVIDSNVEFIEVKLEGGLTIPPASVIINDPYNISNKIRMDSINLLCSRYQHEIDSVFSIRPRTKK